jgi:hypothetical protein
MADIESVEVGEDIRVCLKLTPVEYEVLGGKVENLLLISAELDKALTTGKIGNSNRIMVPKKLLHEHNISKLPKKVPSKIFEIRGDKFLLLKLEESKEGIPIFEED